MSKIEQFKLTIRFSSNIILCAILSFVYYWVWNNVYNPEFENTFRNQGKMFLVAVYFLVLLPLAFLFVCFVVSLYLFIFADY